MTTWPGFGDGTFHDPDRRRQYPDNHGPDNPCPGGCLYCTGIYVGEIDKAPEVTEALKIMYPEEKK